MRHDGGDLWSGPVGSGAPGRPGGRSGGDRSDSASGGESGKALTHISLIDRDRRSHYPLWVKSAQITPEPDEAERKAILEALAADNPERSTASEWAAALLPAREEDEREP